jgi:hypothetical protein
MSHQFPILPTFWIGENLNSEKDDPRRIENIVALYIIGKFCYPSFDFFITYLYRKQWSYNKIWGKRDKKC